MCQGYRICERVMGKECRGITRSKSEMMKPESWESLILLVLKADYGS